MIVMWWLIGITVLACLVSLATRFRVVASAGHVGWDGSRIYKPGSYWSLYSIAIINVMRRITTFGEDELGIVSVVSTSRLDSGETLHSDWSAAWTQGSSEQVTTRLPKSYRQKFIIVWEPDVVRIAEYVHAGDVAERLADLLKTVPTVALESYAPILGIKILSVEATKRDATPTTVIIGDGAEIPDDVRDKHVYVLGRPGKGKSQLLLNLIRQDIENGKGVALIDPHGDLAKEVLRFVPRRRVSDTIYFDPITSPVGIDFLSATDEHERDRVAEDLVSVLGRLTAGAGDRMQSVLSHAARTLVAVPGLTFLDLYRLVKNDYFRNEVVQKLQDRDLIDYWRDDWPKHPHPATEEPIISRMGKFASRPALRATIGALNGIKMYDVIQSKKIFIANISKGALGDETSALLGGLLVSQIQLAAFRRASLHKSERSPYCLYVDEFQNFTTSSFHTIISEGRKFQLWQTLANQRLGDLDDKVRGAVRGVETSIYFQPYDDEAAAVAKSLAGRFTGDDLLGLDTGEAIVRIKTATNSSRVLVDLPPKTPTGFLEEIMENTRHASAARPTPGESGVGSSNDDVEPSEPPE